MTIRKVDENEPRVSYRVCYSTCHVVSDPFQQTLPGHIHIKADTFQNGVCASEDRFFTKFSIHRGMLYNVW